MLFANIECFSFLCSLNLEKMLQRVSSVLFVSLLLLVYVVTGIGFSRHTCCQGQTRIALLLEETEDCGHVHEAQQTSAEYGVEASGCCHTEVYQFLPDCLAQRGEDVPESIFVRKNWRCRCGNIPFHCRQTSLHRTGSL